MKTKTKIIGKSVYVIENGEWVRHIPTQEKPKVFKPRKVVRLGSVRIVKLNLSVCDIEAIEAKHKAERIEKANREYETFQSEIADGFKAAASIVKQALQEERKTYFSVCVKPQPVSVTDAKTPFNSPRWVENHG